MGLSVVSGLLLAPPASAACHAFTVSVSPASVSEGGTTTVTVERDGDVGPSSVRVRTVDGTAKAGSDYAGVSDRTVTFAQGTSETFVVSTTNDSAAESAETFKVELIEGSGAGCAPNPDFHYGPPATVTITANDQPAPTKAPTTAPPTSRAPTAPRTTAPATTPPAVRTTAPPTTPAPPTTAPATTSAPADTAPPETLGESPSPAAADNSGGGGLPLAAVAVAALLVAAGLGFLGYRGLRSS